MLICLIAVKKGKKSFRESNLLVVKKKSDGFDRIALRESVVAGNKKRESLTFNGEIGCVSRYMLKLKPTGKMSFRLFVCRVRVIWRWNIC